jgi:hypothetical protein
MGEPATNEKRARTQESVRSGIVPNGKDRREVRTGEEPTTQRDRARVPPRGIAVVGSRIDALLQNMEM